MNISYINYFYPKEWTLVIIDDCLIYDVDSCKINAALEEIEKLEKTKDIVSIISAINKELSERKSPPD